MQKGLVNIVIKQVGKILPLVTAISFLCIFSSCFTGIEGTKKIHLSREDKKLAKITPEEKLMEPIKPVPLKDWEEGKKFVASDDKALLVIVPQSGRLPYAPDSIKGKVLQFKGVESKINAAGDLVVALLFTDDNYIYSYNSGKEFDDAMENLNSDRIPMLIDESMVKKAGEILSGKKLWSRTNLWYDEEDNRIDGRKFIAVTVQEVYPGDMVFPLRLKFITEDGVEGYVYMNFGNEDNESRAFHNLFSLTDIRKHYPSIDAETWDFISRGKVKEGMTKEECRLSLGTPSDIRSGHDYSQTLDIWNYDNGRILWFEDGKLVKIRQ